MYHQHRTLSPFMARASRRDCSGSKQWWRRMRGRGRERRKGRERDEKERERESPLTCITRSSAALPVSLRRLDFSTQINFSSPSSHSLICRRSNSIGTITKQSDVRRERHRETLANRERKVWTERELLCKLLDLYS